MSANRRIKHILGHILPQEKEVSIPLSQFQAEKCSSNNKDPEGSIYPSVDGKQSKYARIHGNVSTEKAVWVPAFVRGDSLQHVLYEKAVHEGIAKVKNFLLRC